MKRILFFSAVVLMALFAGATPPNTPVLDGRPIEYDATDLRGSFSGASSWDVNGTLSNLFVTWDAEYLYVALQAWQADNNKLVVLLDVDPGNGTGATTTTNWTSVEPSFIKYNDYGWVDGGGFGLDYMLASEGVYNNAIRVLYDGVEAPSTNNMESLFDAGNGSTPAGTPIDMAALNDATDCVLKGFEARIPWAELYHDERFGTVEPGATVPRGATLRILGGIHNNNPDSAWSSPDTIPVQESLVYDNGILTASDYLTVAIDLDGDGIPDMLDGDVNAPYIQHASGAVDGGTVYVVFNEPVTASTAANTANWSVGGVTPSAATVQGATGVLLELPAPIASGDMLLVRATGVEDAAANSRVTDYCLFPAAGGISQSVEVTFQVNTNSGMGISSKHSKPSAFFINGSALPLEWGYPPSANTPLTPIPGSNGWAQATVTFPPGSPTLIHYKYSALIGGTNNFEAIRLTDFAAASRELVLNNDGTPMTVREYLGAAAHPLRNPGSTNEPSAHHQLFSDPQRGDAGVRARREICFRLDLSFRKRDNLQRVMVMGSDPLRGFNSTGDNTDGTASDYPGNSAYLDWDAAGIELFDDGTHGDEVAGDGIYSRMWAFSTNGVDATSETGSPHSLVGGRDADWVNDIPGTEPYQGNTYWKDGRSPRSLVYKFYVLTTGHNSYESPDGNLTYYIADPEETEAIVLAPFIWDNDALPPPPPENAPDMRGVTLAGTTATVEFENVETEGGHGVRISTNLLNGFNDYGTRAASVGEAAGGIRPWAATIPEATDREYYQAYAGPEPVKRSVLYWEPNPIPVEATTWRVYFCQFQSNLKGMRSMTFTGNFSGWGTGAPMTFLSNGIWFVDIELEAGTDGDGLEFKPRGGPTHEWLDEDDNFKAMRGTGGVTWEPQNPISGERFTVTIDVASTSLAGATNVNIHLGFDDTWAEASDRPMTNTVDSIWEYSLTVPAAYSVSANWVFNGWISGSQTWYSPSDWKAWILP